MDSNNIEESAAHFEPIVEVPVTCSPLADKRKKCYRKKVETEWSHECILKLIREIEMRRSLWDVGCAQYKLPKELLWQEVADAVNMSANNCKGKWANLRITFNANLDKQRKKKSGQGTSETAPITWKYFRPMLFLESNKVSRSTKSTSSLQIHSATDDETFLIALDEELPVSTSHRRKTDVSTTPFDSDTSQSRGSIIKEMAVEALQSMRSASNNPKTPSALLCEYMASELDTLTPEKAALARLKLRQAFNDIMAEVLMTSSSQQEQSGFDASQIIYVARDPKDTPVAESFYQPHEDFSFEVKHL